VWPGFGNAKFKPTVAGADMPGYINKGQEFTYEKHGKPNTEKSRKALW